MSTAILLMEAACPVLVGREDARFQFTTDWGSRRDWRSGELGRWWGAPLLVRVADGNALLLGAGSAPGLAVADAWFGTGGQIITFRVGGPMCGASTIDGLETEVSQMPNRNDVVARDALAAHGAKYPPDQPAKARARAEDYLRVIAPVIGKARILSIDFPAVPALESPDRRPWDSPSGPSAVVTLRWLVRAKTEHSELSLIIDPLEGVVDSLKEH